jgi:hypothetical protein
VRLAVPGGLSNPPFLISSPAPVPGLIRVVAAEAEWVMTANPKAAAAIIQALSILFPVFIFCCFWFLVFVVGHFHEPNLFLSPFTEI